MPDISLLQPTVLRGVVEKFTAPESLIMLNRLPRQPWPYPTMSWDIIQGSRMVAKPNVPNSEAHIVPRLGRGRASASFIYLREKKVFEPTTLHWIREPGQIARTNAEAAVMREVNDLNQRFDNYAEKQIWQALTGTITISTLEVRSTIDYQFANTHKPSVGTTWASATPQQIVADIRTWKRLVARDGRVPAREVFCTEVSMSRIFTSFTANADAAALLSDRMKDSYYQTGMIPGFMGLNWTVTESIYDDDNGTDTLFVPDDALFMGNFTDNRPIYLAEGPSADDDAPSGFTGKFAKTWKEPDPSGRQYLLEWNMLPVIERPEQFIYVADLTP